MQNGNSDIEIKSQPKSWVKFILAMSILAIFEFCYLSIPSIPSRNMVIELIKVFYIVIFLPNLILGPLAFLWFGTLYSPADKKTTCYIIGTVLAVVAIFLSIKPSITYGSHYKFNYFIIGVFYAGIIGILANWTYHRLPGVQRRSEVKGNPAVVAFGSGIVIGILLILMYVSFPSPMSSRRSAWMARAKGTLRSIGSSQLAYQRSNFDRNFGSFSGIQHALYIAEGSSLGNMMENYSMTWSVYNSPRMSGNRFGVEGIHTFTIVAYPRDTYPGYLLTFGITEDQVVRVYNPDSVKWPNEYNGLYDPRVWTWDPIL